MALKLKSASGAKPKTGTRSTKKIAPKRAVNKAVKTTGRGVTKRAPKEVEEEKVDRRTAEGKVDPRVLARHEDALIEIGERMAAAQAERKAALEDAYSVTQSALEDEVPMALVSRLTGISRQWLYNMGNHAGRNGSATQGRLGPRGGATKGKARKPIARKTGTAARKTAVKSASRKAPSASKKISIKRK